VLFSILFFSIAWSDFEAFWSREIKVRRSFGAKKRIFHWTVFINPVMYISEWTSLHRRRISYLSTYLTTDRSTHWLTDQPIDDRSNWTTGIFEAKRTMAWVAGNRNGTYWTKHANDSKFKLLWILSENFIHFSIVLVKDWKKCMSKRQCSRPGQDGASPKYKIEYFSQHLFSFSNCSWYISVWERNQYFQMPSFHKNRESHEPKLEKLRQLILKKKTLFEEIKLVSRI